MIASTTGLGDTLWATPAIRAVKTTYPKCHLSVLTSPIGSEVLKHNPYIDETIIAADPLLPKTPKLIHSLKKNPFDTVLIFHTSQRLALPICRFAKPKMIVGTKGINKGLDTLLTTQIQPYHEHEITRRLRITQEIGVRADSEQLEWTISPDETLLANAFLSDYKKPLVGLHPGAKDQFKQWPKEHFIQLGKALARDGFQVLVTGNHTEKPLAGAIASQIPGAKSIAGLLPLRNFAAALSKFDLFITNDTGPMHISFALGVKTVALFGPTDPTLCGPHHAQNCLIFSKPRTCNPCLKKSCRDPFCMKQFGPSQILADVKRLYMGEKCLSH